MVSQIQRCVDAIAERLGQQVSLTDTELNSLYFSPHNYELIDDVRRSTLLRRTTAPWIREWFASNGVNAAMVGPTRVEPHPHNETLSRWVMPVRRAGVNYGLLSVIDPERRYDDASVALIEDLVSELADLMYADEANRLAPASLVQEALMGTSEVRTAAIAALQRATDLSSDTPILVITISGVPGAKPRPRSPGQQPVRTRRLPVLQCAAGDHHAFIVPESADLRVVVDYLQQVATRCCGTPVAGVGDPLPLADCDRSHEQARAAMSIAARLPELGEAATFEELGALRFFAGVTDTALSTAIDPRVRKLLAASDPCLRDTVRVYLDSGGDAAGTSDALNVHRSTLYYRLRRAAEITGMDWSTGQDRLTTHLGLLAARLVDSETHHGHQRPVQLLPI